MIKAKPFIKWVGGKGQLIEQLDAQLPFDYVSFNEIYCLFVSFKSLFLPQI